MTDLVVGTDHRTLVSTVGAQDGPASTTPVPAGLRHAVPRGTRVALCGEAPAVLWDGEAWPGRAHQSDVCPVCRAVMRSRSPGPH